MRSPSLESEVGLDVGGHDRELHLVEEGRQRRLAVVEFVVADGHGVELHVVQELGFGRTLVGRVEKRALEIVAGVQ